jgi:hypothetical protein
MPFRVITTATLDELVTWWRGAQPEWVDSSWHFEREVTNELFARPEGRAFFYRLLTVEDVRDRRRALLELSKRRVTGQAVQRAIAEAFASQKPILQETAVYSCLLGRTFLLPVQEVEALFKDPSGSLAGQALAYLVLACPCGTSAHGPLFR